MEAFVLDVSACIPWRCEDETTPASERMLEWAMQGSELHVPSLWVWEILNVAGVIIRRRRVTADRGREFLKLLATLKVRIDRPPHITDLPRLHALANSYDLTAYDVAYLDLAKRLSLPLATRDDDLGKAALAEGVAVL
ncbi:MAG: type II toxin-antitoxin system VapC family toxin [Bryobacteraceae bacterium]|jgi:predicted nucleic acid-binding protein